MSPHSILEFWFEIIPRAAWWEKSPAFDDELRQRFGAVHAAAMRGELWAWRSTAAGRLAEILLLDQFSRNIFRDTPKAFAGDSMALVLAQEAVRVRVYESLNADQQAFLFMPYMHSESLAVHDEALRLFARPGLEDNLDFEHRHRVIIERFGRYPHRNAILGRPSTAAELAFLAEPGSSF